MKKSRRFLGSIVSMATVFVVFSLVFVFALGANAASTIGTNASTTGTFLVNPASNSTTSVRFQNAAGTNFFIADSTNSRIGIGAAPSTTFEVQGTASASYLMTANSLQVFGVASVAYSRFGVAATGHSLAAADDVLFAGLVEFDDNAFFDARVGINGAPSTTFEVQGTASASYLMTANSLQVFGVASVAYSRFGVAATGHSLAAADDVLFAGLVEFDDFAYFDSGASVSSNFEVGGYASASKGFITTALVVGSNVASGSSAYLAEFVSTGTVSLNFMGTSTTKGTCLQLQNTVGAPVFVRVVGTTLTVSAISCR